MNLALNNLLLFASSSFSTLRIFRCVHLNSHEANGSHYCHCDVCHIEYALSESPIENRRRRRCHLFTEPTNSLVHKLCAREKLKLKWNRPNGPGPTWHNVDKLIIFFFPFFWNWQTHSNTPESRVYLIKRNEMEYYYELHIWRASSIHLHFTHEMYEMFYPKWEHKNKKKTEKKIQFAYLLNFLFRQVFFYGPTH